MASVKKKLIEKVLFSGPNKHLSPILAHSRKILETSRRQSLYEYVPKVENPRVFFSSIEAIREEDTHEYFMPPEKKKTDNTI